MKVALIQMESTDSVTLNEARAFTFLAEAASVGADIICLPEKFLYWGKDMSQGKMRMKDVQKYCNFARENNVNLILGSIAMEIEGCEKTANTSFAIDRKGEIVGKYDKKYMYVADLPNFKTNEGLETAPGKSFGLATLDGITVGIGICVDLRYPEYFRELTAKGAEVVFLPAHFFERTGKTAWEVLTRARAIENQMYFCACNNTGKRLCGGTKVVDYNGRVIGKLEKEEGVLTVELDFTAQKQFRRDFPLLAQM